MKHGQSARISASPHTQNRANRFVPKHKPANERTSSKKEDDPVNAGFEGGKDGKK